MKYLICVLHGKYVYIVLMITFHLNSYMREVEIFEFVHDIQICYLENFKEQEFEEKKFLFYSIVRL